MSRSDGSLAWLRSALAPIAWTAVAIVAASLLGLAVQLVFAGGPDAGRWNPTWSFAEVQLPEADAAEARALVEEARPLLPDRVVEWRAAEEGSWIVLAGPGDRQELLTTLREVVGRRGHAPTSIGFGSNLARITDALLEDPRAITEAAGTLLPVTLFGGSLALLAFGAALRRRLDRGAPPAIAPSGSGPRRTVAGIGLGLLLALGVEALGALMEALGHEIVEQGWVLQLIERGGPELLLALPMIVVLAPLAEEVFFRGYLLEALRPAWGRVGSVVVSSAAFAAVHGHAPALPAYLLYGACLAVAARRSGTLLVPVVAHVTVNVLAMARAWLQGS